MNQQKQTIVKPKRKYYKSSILCNECNKKRPRLDESHQICHLCYKAKAIFIPSGNKIIDDFIKHTLINSAKLKGKMVFVPYDRFQNVEFISEGGFSKIYKAIWIDGPAVNNWNHKEKCYFRPKSKQNYPVVLKKLNHSNDVTSKELNELKVFYKFSVTGTLYSKKNICKYFGITQDPITQDIMIIMPYYKSGDLINFITNDFYSISWKDKLDSLQKIASGLRGIHIANIVHRDLHSGNIFFQNNKDTVIGDLGISKSATESTDDDNNNENYGIIPYMAPEIFKGEKYTTASDIYSFGMIMWEFMTGRRPFWNRIHNAELIIEICDGLRPPIVTNAPEGYIELMKQCWHSDTDKRSSFNMIYSSSIRGKIEKMYNKEYEKPTKIIESPDIGPATMNNPGAIYKSRPLSGMIQSAMSTRSLRSQSINLETDQFHYYQKSNIFFNDKRKFEDTNQSENNFNGKNIKKIKLIENENNDYATKEFELDVDMNFKQYKNDHEYTTQEINFDINTYCTTQEINFDINTF